MSGRIEWLIVGLMNLILHQTRISTLAPRMLPSEIRFPWTLFLFPASLLLPSFGLLKAEATPPNQRPSWGCLSTNHRQGLWGGSQERDKQGRCLSYPVKVNFLPTKRYAGGRGGLLLERRCKWFWTKFLSVFSTVLASLKNLAQPPATIIDYTKSTEPHLKYRRYAPGVATC